MILALIKIFIIKYNIMIQKTFEGFERGYPLIILFSLFMSYFMTHKIDFLIFVSSCFEILSRSKLVSVFSSSLLKNLIK